MTVKNNCFRCANDLFWDSFDKQDIPSCYDLGNIMDSCGANNTDFWLARHYYQLSTEEGDSTTRNLIDTLENEKMPSMSREDSFFHELEPEDSFKY